MNDRKGRDPDDQRAGRELTALEDENRALELELARARKRLEELAHETERLENRADWYRSELEKVQAHLTRILASRVFRYSRLPRRIWYKLKGSG